MTLQASTEGLLRAAFTKAPIQSVEADVANKITAFGFQNPSASFVKNSLTGRIFIYMWIMYTKMI
jgi:hypothetical protein